MFPSFFRTVSQVARCGALELAALFVIVVLIALPAVVHAAPDAAARAIRDRATLATLSGTWARTQPESIAQASRRVPGAFDAVFMEDSKHVTLRTRDAKLIEAFGFAACGLEPGVEKDISVQGCAAWKPVAVCREDHDLLALGEGGALHFGTRPRDNDLCTPDKRPTALLPAVVKR